MKILRPIVADHDGLAFKNRTLCVQICDTLQETRRKGPLGVTKSNTFILRQAEKRLVLAAIHLLHHYLVFSSFQSEKTLITLYMAVGFIARACAYVGCSRKSISALEPGSGTIGASPGGFYGKQKQQ